MMKPLATAVLLAAALPAAAEAQTAAEKNVHSWAQPVDKKANFYRIDPKLYRSEQLFQPADAAMLEAQNIKTIINLRFFDRNDDKKAFGTSRFRLVNMPLVSWAVSPKDVARVLKTIETAQRHGAVLVHCYHGADRTGLIAAFYRIIYQGWPAVEARREMIEGPYGFHSVWRNMENFFTGQNIAAVREELERLRAAEAAGAV